MVRDGKIHTPPLGASVLPGITRDSHSDARARDLGIPVVETIVPREMLYIADEVFFSGTAAEITPIRSIDRIVIGKGRRGPIAEALQQEFFGVINGTQAGRARLAVPRARRATAVVKYTLIGRLRNRDDHLPRDLPSRPRSHLMDSPFVARASLANASTISIQRFSTNFFARNTCTYDRTRCGKLVNKSCDSMNCSGMRCRTGKPIEIAFDEAIALRAAASR